MITISKYIDILNITETSTYNFELVSLVYDLDFDDVQDMDIDEFNNKLIQIQREISVRNVQDNTNWNGHILNFTLDKIKFGRYIDLDTLLNKGEFHQFAQRFFQIDEDLYDLPVAALFKAIDTFIAYRNSIYQTYEVLFDGDSTDEEESNEERFVSPKRSFAEQLKKNKEEQQKKWGWISIAFSLAKNDITKMDEVLGLDFIFVLNMLVMVKQLEINLNPNAYPTMEM